MLTAVTGMMPAAQADLRAMPWRRHAGFSLIEIMAVIFVVGLALGMASLAISTGGPKEEVWESIEQFLGESGYASEHAILSTQTVGLRLQPPEWQVERGQDIREIGWRWQWLVMTRDGWRELENPKATRLPPTIKLTVEVNEQLWDYEEQIDRTTPIAAFYPSGDITPFSIQWTDTREPGFQQHVEVDENGELVWLEAPELPEESDNGF